MKTTLTVTGGYGSDVLDSFQLAQRQLKESGIDAELKVQEYAAYITTTFLGKYEGMALGPFSIAWEPHTALYGMYTPEQPRNSGHVADARIVAMLKEQMRTKDLEARREVVFDIQRYAAEQRSWGPPSGSPAATSEGSTTSPCSAWSTPGSPSRSWW